jgi:hypothetical protein
MNKLKMLEETCSNRIIQQIRSIEELLNAMDNGKGILVKEKEELIDVSPGYIVNKSILSLKQMIKDKTLFYFFNLK